MQEAALISRNEPPQESLLQVMQDAQQCFAARKCPSALFGTAFVIFMSDASEFDEAMLSGQWDDCESCHAAVGSLATLTCSMRRGLQVYKEVCSTCHSLNFIAYRNLDCLNWSASSSTILSFLVQPFLVLSHYLRACSKQHIAPRHHLQTCHSLPHTITSRHDIHCPPVAIVPSINSFISYLPIS